VAGGPSIMFRFYLLMNRLVQAIFFLSGQRGVTDVLILNYGHTGGTLIYNYSRLAEINHSFDVARDL
jgi:hypothetical protein